MMTGSKGPRVTRTDAASGATSPSSQSAGGVSLQPLGNGGGGALGASEAGGGGGGGTSSMTHSSVGAGVAGGSAARSLASGSIVGPDGGGRPPSASTAMSPQIDDASGSLAADHPTADGRRVSAFDQSGGDGGAAGGGGGAVVIDENIMISLDQAQNERSGTMSGGYGGTDGTGLAAPPPTHHRMSSVPPPPPPAEFSPR